MVAVLIGNWWALVLRGVAAILFALICFFAPIVTGTALVWVFAAYALADGVFALVAAARALRGHRASGALLLEGILDIVVAVVIFLWPGPALVALIYLIAIWAVLSGVMLIMAGFALRQLAGEWLLILSGVVSLLFGVVLFMQPAVGVVALAWWLGIYALLFGIVLLGAGFRLRGRAMI